MFDRIKKDNQGFTIIEVLIVLAIAGLIMIIVFLAVPALQRNNRNQSYRTQANNISSAYQEISANKGGTPLTASNSTVPTPATPTDADKVRDSANPKDLVNVRIEAHNAADVAWPASQNYNTVIIRTGAKCASDTTALTATQGSTRQIAVYFQVESTGGAVNQCVSS